MTNVSNGNLLCLTRQPSRATARERPRERGLPVENAVNGQEWNRMQEVKATRRHEEEYEFVNDEWVAHDERGKTSEYEGCEGASWKER